MVGLLSEEYCILPNQGFNQLCYNTNDVFWKTFAIGWFGQRTIQPTISRTKQGNKPITDNKVGCVFLKF